LETAADGTATGEAGFDASFVEVVEDEAQYWDWRMRGSGDDRTDIVA
jgi:hypothetical protein